MNDVAMTTPDLVHEGTPAARPDAPSSTLRVVFAGGGTGGHLYPPLAIAAALRDLHPRMEATFFGTHRAVDARILGAAKQRLVPQPVRPFTMKPWRWPAFLVAWRKSLDLCATFFKTHRPHVVVGSGGFASGPAIRAAEAMGIPTALLNPDACPGRANRHVGPYVRVIFAQWPQSAAHFQRGADVRALGCPIRPEFGSVSRDEACRRLGLLASRRTLLVTGASQGARSINHTMMLVADELAKRSKWQVVHLTGSADRALVADAYRTFNVQAKCIDYCDDMPAAMAAADAIISRAGASTLAEITASGLPSLLLPYPFDRRRHQAENARILEEAGAACMINDTADAAATAAELRPRLCEILDDDVARNAMASKAAALGKPNAASDIAAALFAMCENG